MANGIFVFVLQVQHELQLEGCQSLGGVPRCAAQVALTLQFPLVRPYCSPL